MIEELKQDMDAKSLLKHPFYQMWNDGTLPREALVEYAKQYYHFTEHFPRFVAGIYSNCTDVEQRKVLLQNLIEEEIGDYNDVNPHAEQWMKFAEVMGAPRESVLNCTLLPETKEFLATFEELTKKDFHSGVAAVLSYEWQVSPIAKTKKEGLCNHFGLTSGMEFFDTHMIADIRHSQVWRNILSQGAINEAEVREAFNKGLQAQWKFLDGLMPLCKNGSRC